jgi:hypothetical protein
MAISDFQNFEFLTPKNQNFDFLENVCHKIHNFQNFQKTGIYVTYLSIGYTHAKFQNNISIFDRVIAS